ncbi:ATP-binding protein [Flavobacterium ponti]|uniref:ATP-binding protein n=1 Tax=Flavobacterium ponti TaxID=665133 RepID=A0ABV9P904_9FLAO
MEDIEIKVGIEVILSYKRLSYSPWYALAEFVDNSTQAYFNNQAAIEEQLRKDGERLTVDINYNRTNNTITISDNSIGMSGEELRNALMIGVPPDYDKGRSKYGLGLKTAACWFGNFWTIETKKLGESSAYKVTVDVNKIAKERVFKLPTDIIDSSPEKHYTKICIQDLNRQYHGKTINKIKEFLSSLYRFDFDNINLLLRWQGEDISWKGFEGRFYITQDGKPYKKPLSFTIGENKVVTGWVGVLAKGSRKDAGFSIIQNNRIIRGWPSAYKPSSIFGDDGTNDLVNQRLVGELFMDGFAVSHTKDNILWVDDEEEELELKLGELCADAKALAGYIRVSSFNVVDDNSDAIRYEALSLFESELKSSEIRDKLFNEIIPDDRAITASFQNLIETTQRNDEPVIEVSIGEDEDVIFIKVFFRNVSEFEPYVLIESSIENNTLLVIINLLHPYWQELKNLDSYLTFIRHCVYDGISEWKASKKLGRLNHDTVKYIKDILLRLPFEITNNKFRE